MHRHSCAGIRLRRIYSSLSRFPPSRERRNGTPGYFYLQFDDTLEQIWPLLPYYVYLFPPSIAGQRVRKQQCPEGKAGPLILRQVQDERPEASLFGLLAVPAGLRLHRHFLFFFQFFGLFRHSFFYSFPFNMLCINPYHRADQGKFDQHIGELPRLRVHAD